MERLLLETPPADAEVSGRELVDRGVDAADDEPGDGEARWTASDARRSVMSSETIDREPPSDRRRGSLCSERLEISESVESRLANGRGWTLAARAVERDRDRDDDLDRDLECDE
ncbi:uncharacterized protein AMSG_10267 [Thecamonas trahens ATCC 50062]|uniref:EAL domain-containing protein n=1 Tax=Thecamonas trahens ATCC 50062 TaxID=461836 RepID=A0A0L0DS60_THETB|nr:hypothetical protein AMSG_10267 [Thecamonas trahens ATCC 50062]KNC54288.1 hypothetical protein AMSG_10267 [Thecamonas trahens ATCC 50062]|eukprot:XP_013753753.1 hypothetical protein AMSG_10267 [Thecamonas trahens ATCC 50062]